NGRLVGTMLCIISHLLTVWLAPLLCSCYFLHIINTQMLHTGLRMLHSTQLVNSIKWQIPILQNCIIFLQILYNRLLSK
ncbi:mCG1033801, partial [Mus musculus]